MEADNIEAEPQSTKEPILETGGAKSEPGLPDTAEPAAAGKPGKRFMESTLIQSY